MASSKHVWRHVQTGLLLHYCDEMVEEEDEHDLSHEVLQKRLHSIPSHGGIECKDARCTHPRGIKAANSGGGIYLKYAADYLLGPLTTN